MLLESYLGLIKLSHNKDFKPNFISDVTKLHVYMSQWYKQWEKMERGRKYLDKVIGWKMLLSKHIMCN